MVDNTRISDAESAMIHATPDAEDSEEALNLLKEAFNRLEYGHEIVVHEQWVQRTIALLDIHFQFDKEKQIYVEKQI